MKCNEWCRDDCNCGSPEDDDAGLPAFADTCCGKCPGDTCYVDQMTGA